MNKLYGCLLTGLSMVLFAQCGGIEDAPAVDPIEGREGEIVSGTTRVPSENSGNVALEYLDSATGKYWTFCSGALLTTRWMITAKHCLNDSRLAGKILYARMGAQRVRIWTWWLNPSWDVGLGKLAVSMKMWNWYWTGYATFPAQLDNTTYNRQVSTVTNASLNNTYQTCDGFGPGGFGAIQKYATFPIRFGDGLNPTTQPHIYKNGTQIPEGGDSGMACTPNVMRPWEGSITIIQSGCFSSLGFCYGAGAESFRKWVYDTMSANR